MSTENLMSTEIPGYSEIIQAPVLIYNIFSSQNPQFPYMKITKPTNGGFGITLNRLNQTGCALFHCVPISYYMYVVPLLHQVRYGPTSSTEVRTVRRTCTIHTVLVV